MGPRYLQEIYGNIYASEILLSLHTGQMNETCRVVHASTLPVYAFVFIQAKIVVVVV